MPAAGDLARNQFGSATPMTGYASTREVLRELDAGNATLGVLPVPHEGDTDLWWAQPGHAGRAACFLPAALCIDFRGRQRRAGRRLRRRQGAARGK